MTLPKAIIFGPSGAGKSTIAAELASRYGWKHLEFDVEGKDAVNDFGLRKEWDLLVCKHQPKELAVALEELARNNNWSGVVISVPSVMWFPSHVLIECRQSGITPIILFGSPEDCLLSFLQRERKTGRGLTVTHWIQNNQQQISRFAADDYRTFRVNGFKERYHRSKRDLAREIAGMTRQHSSDRL